MPLPVKIIVRRMSAPITFVRVAPSAMRKPISRVRPTTIYDITP
jgi:hypothetical protein